MFSVRPLWSTSQLNMTDALKVLFGGKRGLVGAFSPLLFGDFFQISFT